jgi:beta-carotene 3-hydroxylase
MPSGSTDPSRGGGGSVSTMTALVVALVAFAAMEPVTAATHRWVMHGVGERLHRSHHQRHDGRWEANDLYPVLFASIVCAALWAGFNIDGVGVLVPAGLGITAYGAAYAFVHDAYIHHRLGGLGRRRVAVLDRLADAHRIHHLFGEAPYGMLVPVVPARLRERAARTARDPFAQPSGSTPSHVPADA